MKIIKIFCFGVFAITRVYGQTVTVKGTVHNQKEQPVPYAFVRDAQHNYATFTDSTGTFVLKADPSSSLYVSANNYRDTRLKLDDKTNVNIVLPESTDEGGVLSLKSGHSAETSAFLRARQQLAVGKGSVIGGGPGGGGGGSDVTLVRSGFAVEPTRGSRYLFDDWVPGFGINKKDSLVVEKTNMYNYDKIGGNIIYTNDGRSIAQVSPSQLKSFTLYDKHGHGHVYENAPAINGKPFTEVLLSTPKYKIYKKIDSKLTRADYHTDGVLEVGHRYDEYTDVNRYYFVALPDGKAQNISLKKSTLKKLLGSDADTFIASQGSRDVDEDYVRDLGSSLNK